MFGKSKDMEIAEIKTGTLKVHYVDFITEKRKKTNEITGNDKFEVFFSDASEEEFKRLVDEFAAENKKFQWGEFLNLLAKNDYYCYYVSQYYSKRFAGESY